MDCLGRERCAGDLLHRQARAGGPPHITGQASREKIDEGIRRALRS